MSVVFTAKRILEHTGDMGAAMKQAKVGAENQARVQGLIEDFRKLE